MQNTNINKLRATLRAGEALSNARRLLARFNSLLTDGVPAQGVTAQELIEIIGQDEAQRIIAANAVFAAAPLSQPNE